MEYITSGIEIRLLEEDITFLHLASTVENISSAD